MGDRSAPVTKTQVTEALQTPTGVDILHKRTFFPHTSNFMGTFPPHFFNQGKKLPQSCKAQVPSLKGHEAAWNSSNILEIDSYLSL